jgi:endonuclease YncB( thermonuclease family)
MNLTEQEKDEILKCKDCNINNFSLKGKEFYCKVVNVYDADTCRAVFFLNGDLVKYTIRLKGVDSPEIRPPSSDKYRHFQITAAKQSRNRLIQLCTDCELEIESELSKSKIQKLINDNKKIIKIKCEEFDKYGRLLASLYTDIDRYSVCESNEDPVNKEKVPNKLLNINHKLIDEGFAYEYDGGTKKKFNYEKYLE